MPEKRRVNGNSGDPTTATNIVGEWGGPRGHVVGPNHPKKTADKTSFGEVKALVGPT